MVARRAAQTLHVFVASVSSRRRLSLAVVRSYPVASSDGRYGGNKAHLQHSISSRHCTEAEQRGEIAIAILLVPGYDTCVISLKYKASSLLPIVPSAFALRHPSSRQTQTGASNDIFFTDMQQKPIASEDLIRLQSSTHSGCSTTNTRSKISSKFNPPTGRM